MLARSNRSAKNQVEAYNLANQSFLKELNRIREENKKREERRLDNVLAIAQDNTDRKSNILIKQVLATLAVAGAGYFLLKEI